MKKKPNTNIRLKGRDGEEIGVHIDDQDRPRGAYKDAVERGVLSRIDDILAYEIANAPICDEDGNVIAEAGAVTWEQYAEIRRSLGAWTTINKGEAGKILVPPHPDGLLFGKRANADLITNQMRTEMLNVAAKMLDEMPEEDSAPLSAWINDSRIENFREWLLGKGGWDKAIAERRPLQDELGRCFAGVSAVAIPNNREADIEGDELKAWQMKFSALHLAGSRTAPVERSMQSLIEGDPIKYLNALREAFDRELWPVLLKTAEDVGDPFAWLRIMVRPYVEEQAAHIVQTRISSIGIMVRARAKTEAGEEYTAFPRVLGSSMPMIGGHFTIEYNGEKYAQEPTLAEKAIHGTLRTLQKQQSVDVVPTAWAKKETEQYTLALDIEIAKPYLRDAHGAPLKLTASPMEVVVGTATAARLPALTIKAIPYMIAACGLTDRKVIDPLEKVGRDLYPAYATGKGGQIKPWATRQQVDKDLHNIVQAITIAGRGLQVRVTEESGSYRYYDLFSINAPSIIKPDELIGWRINPWLLEKMLGGTAGGHFLLNMTRWLPIGLTDPGLFSVIFGIAKTLDAHRIHGIYAPERARQISWDQFADQCNVLPMISERRDEKSIKASRREARNKLEARLDTAQELGHLGDWRKTMRKLPGGKGFEFSIVAPPDYPEACKMAVKAWRGQSRRKGGQKGKAGEG